MISCHTASQNFAVIFTSLNRKKLKYIGRLDLVLLMIRRICVIGPTQTGTGIAQIAASTGIDVTLTGCTGTELDEGVKIMKRNLKMDHDVRRMSTKAQNEHIEKVLAKIPMTTDLMRAVRDADLILEAVEEKTDAKQDRFRIGLNIKRKFRNG